MISSDGFQSEALQAAVEAANDVIENHTQIRDSASNDIKKLEAYLAEKAPKETFEYSLGEGFVADEGCQSYLEYTGGCSGEMHEEILAWKPDPKGRFRLFYTFQKWDCELDVDIPGGPYFGDKSTMVSESKPLIEKSFDTRKAMLKHLPDFVRALADHIKVDAGIPTESPEDWDDIPF